MALGYAAGSALVLLLIAYGGRRAARPAARGRARAGRAAGARRGDGGDRAGGRRRPRRALPDRAGQRLPGLPHEPDPRARALGRGRGPARATCAARRASPRPRTRRRRGATPGCRCSAGRPTSPATSAGSTPRATRRSTLRRLRGRVVLVDFWTYTCINCIRTLPYLRAWDARYRRRGLTIVGVHTPEFAFERDAGNVAAGDRPEPAALPGRPGQRVRDLERLGQPVLARQVPDRRARARALRALRRGRVREDRVGDPRAARRGGRTRASGRAARAPRGDRLAATSRRPRPTSATSARQNFDPPAAARGRQLRGARRAGAGALRAVRHLGRRQPSRGPRCATPSSTPA